MKVPPRSVYLAAQLQAVLVGSMLVYGVTHHNIYVLAMAVAFLVTTIVIIYVGELWKL